MLRMTYFRPTGGQFVYFALYNNISTFSGGGKKNQRLVGEKTYCQCDGDWLFDEKRLMTCWKLFH